MADTSDASLKMLRANHDFPGNYTFKVIGNNTERFSKAVEAATRLVLGDACDLRIAARKSAQGHHQALSVIVGVDAAEDVLAVYAALKDVPGVKFLV